ncbi:MAG: transposase [Spirochaetaceae bacterium]|nr:transposase [Spirochaetaceae bacterium]
MILAYIGDERRSSKAGQVAKHAGLTPGMDCSGETERSRPIARRRWRGRW